MDTDTRRNIAVYYLNFVVVAAVGFVVNPLLLGALGPLLFGVWKSLQRYLDFATVADGRASQALKWIIASRLALSDEEKRRDVGAAIVVWLRWLPVAAMVAVGVTVAVPTLIKGIPHEQHSTAVATAAVLAANTVLAGLLAIPDSVLMGINQGYKSMAITTAVFVLSNAVMVAAAYGGWPLWTLAVIALVAATVNAGLTALMARRAVPWWGLRRPTRADVRRVMGYSAWTLGGMVVEKVYLASELIVVSVMVGAVAVSQYTFTTYVMQFILSIALVTASGFMPKVGAHLGASELREAGELTRSLRHLVVGVAVVGSSAVLAFNGALVTIWVGAGQYLGAWLNALLVILGLQFSLIRMDGQVLDVTMRIGPKVMVGLAGSIGGVLAGLLAYGVTHSLAAAFIAVIAVRLTGNVVYPLLVARAVPGSGVPTPALAWSLALLAVSGLIGPIVQNGSWPLRLAIAAGWFGVVAAACWTGLLPRSTVAALLRRG